MCTYKRYAIFFVMFLFRIQAEFKNKGEFANN